MAYTWGDNGYGQTGNPEMVEGETIPTPCILRSLINHKIKAVACGAAHTIVLTELGACFSWGMNSKGQCGLDTDEIKILKPTPLKTIREQKVSGIACGHAHTFFLTTKGSLFGCGWNQDGQLGFGEQDESVCLPRQLHTTGNEVFTYISCGGCHTIFITDAGKVWATGRNNSGQLGIGTIEMKYHQMQEVTFFNSGGPTISYAQAGEEFTIFVSTKGKVYGAGYNIAGQLGSFHDIDHHPTPVEMTALPNEKIESVVCGKGLVLAMNERGTVFLWGNKPEDQPHVKSDPEVFQKFSQKEVLRIAAGREFFGILLAQTDPEQCYATGSGLNASVKARSKAVFKVKTVDKTGFRRLKGGD